MKNKVKGNLLENKYAWLYEGVSGFDKIEKQKIVPDKIAKTKREVDILLTDSNDKMTMVECRNRKDKDDVTWIEQIPTKMNDLNMDNAIMVSSSGFTKGAINKGNYNNIELETVNDLSDSFLSNKKEEFKFEARFLHLKCNQIDILTTTGVYIINSEFDHSFPLDFLKNEINMFCKGEYFCTEVVEKVSEDLTIFNKGEIPIEVAFQLRPDKEMNEMEKYNYHALKECIGEIISLRIFMNCELHTCNVPLSDFLTVFNADEKDDVKRNKKHKSEFENEKMKYSFTFIEKEFYFSIEFKKISKFWRPIGGDFECYALFDEVNGTKVNIKNLVADVEFLF